MCGIFGSTSIEQFKTLYMLNSERGNFSFGYLATYTDGAAVQIKLKGTPVVDFDPNVNLLLGHTQAPTSSQRSWTAETSHPFTCGDWVVAHNGIITNFEKLKRSYVNITHTNPVDSSIIPALLNCFSTKGFKGATSLEIREVLNLLEGTFAVWIYHIPSNLAYLARCSSTLFFNKETKSFSSVEFPNSEPVPEGIVLTIPDFNRTYTFEYSSPFYAL